MNNRSEAEVDVLRDRVSIAHLPSLVGVIGPPANESILIFEYKSYVLFMSKLRQAEPPDAELILDHLGMHVFAIIRREDFVKCIFSIDLVGDIDHGHYLSLYPDVAAAVGAGEVPSARHHYLIQGYLERRTARKV